MSSNDQQIKKYLRQCSKSYQYLFQSKKNLKHNPTLIPSLQPYKTGLFQTKSFLNQTLFIYLFYMNQFKSLSNFIKLIQSLHLHQNEELPLKWGKLKIALCERNLREFHQGEKEKLQRIAFLYWNQSYTTYPLLNENEYKRLSELALILPTVAKFGIKHLQFIQNWVQHQILPNYFPLLQGNIENLERFILDNIK